MKRHPANAWRLILLLAACVALVFGFACGGGGSSSKQQTITSSGSNVQPITVNAGVDGNYVNGAFTSVTVCVPSSSTCQTIDNVLVDIGSSGLRVVSSALTISLPQQMNSGNAVVECLPFVSGYTWGPVETADIQISGETASSVPIQVIDPSYPTPTACSDQGTPEETVVAVGANGLLGVGNFPQDCGGACVSTGNQNPGLYYSCTASSCTVTGEPLAQQVQNPVALFATDNNGVILELPAVTGPETSLTGSMVFGIGTQSNNGLNGATVYTLDDFGNFTTSFNNQSYDQSFLDSGSNGLYFLTSSISGIPACPDANYFYCPSSTQNLSATNAGSNGSSGKVTFSVANADDLFNSDPTAAVLINLAGPNSISGFDWGLPFFYGRNVYTAIAGASTPGGTGPYWAY